MEPVLYTLREKGEGIGAGLSTATEDSLWKMPQLPSQDGDVICISTRLSPVLHVCVCVVGGKMSTHASYMLHHLQAVLSCTTGMLPLE